MIKSQCYGSTLVSDHSFQPKVSLTKSHGFPSSLVIKKEDYPQKLFKLPRMMTESYDKKEADIVSKMGFSDDVIPHQSVADEFGLQKRNEKFSSLDVLVQAASGFEAQLRNHELEETDDINYVSEKKKNIQIIKDNSNLQKHVLNLQKSIEIMLKMMI